MYKNITHNKFAIALSVLLLAMLFICSTCIAEIAPDAQFMDFDDLPIEEENNNVCYIVLDFDRNIDVYKDDLLNEKLCTINKEGASILYFNSNVNFVYHVWFIDQDGNTVDGYIDFMGVELNSLTESEAAGMLSFGAEPRDVGGVHANLFYTTVLYPSQMPTETPATKEPEPVVTAVPVQEITIPTNSQKEEATAQAQQQKKTNPTKAPSTKTKGNDPTKQSLPDELVFATEEETATPENNSDSNVQDQNEQKKENNEPIKGSTVVTDEELALLGATNSNSNQLLDTVIDFVKTNYLYVGIGAGALLLIIIIAVIAKKKKHRTPKSSLLDR